MPKTVNKHRSILPKIINVKNTFWVSSVNKTGKFKIFSYPINLQKIENIRHKKGAAEDQPQTLSSLF